MTARLDWLGIAEGATQDSRGALALVGVGSNVVRAKSLPHAEGRVFIVTAGDEEGTDIGEGASFEFEFEVVSPVGRKVFSQGSSGFIPERQVVDIDGVGVQFVLQTVMNFQEYGEYRANISMKFTSVDGHIAEVTGTRRMWVLPTEA